MASQPLKIRADQDLAGKVVVITGASRGCSILGTCSSSSSIHLIGTLSDEITTLYKNTNIASTLSEHFSSRVDIFVNNAADYCPGVLGELTVEEIQKSLISNIQTPVLIVEELVKRKMFQKESRIVYISSIRSRQPWMDHLMYAAGKAAGESMCRTWSMAFGGKEEKFAFMAGTTANAVAVGLTETDAVKGSPPELVERFKAEFIPLQSMPQVGQPEGVADVVGLLCSRDARWITGTVVSASGGGIKIG